MAEPVLINQWEWVEVATNITSVVLHNKQTGYRYFYTFRQTGTAPPDALLVEEIPSEAVSIFEALPFEVIKAQYSIDIYILCFNKDKRIEEQGAVRVDLNLGAVNESGGLPYLDVGQPFELKVTQGIIPGHSVLDKFGVNKDIDIATVPEDIWEGGGLYTYDAYGTAPIVSLVSDSDLDTQDIRITGLDINGDEVIQTLALTGTTRVALSTALWRVYRMENVADIGNSLVGSVYCYVGTGGVPTLANTRAIIDNGNNQTLMSIYTIPGGKVGFLYRGEVGFALDANPAASQNLLEAYYNSRRFGKVFRVKKVITSMLAGSSNYVDKRSFPDVVPGLSDLKLTVEAVSADNTGAWGTLDLLLVDEELFPTSYLQAIGQPGY